MGPFSKKFCLIFSIPKLVAGLQVPEIAQIKCENFVKSSSTKSKIFTNIFKIFIFVKVGGGAYYYFLYIALISKVFQSWKKSFD